MTYKVPTDWFTLIGRLRTLGLGGQPPTHMIQVTSTDSTNLNAATPHQIAWNVAALLDKGDFVTHSSSTNNTRITVEADGLYEAGFILPMSTSASGKKNVKCYFTINGSATVEEGHVYAYIDYGGSDPDHTEASAVCVRHFDLSEDDYLEVNTEEVGPSGTVTLSANDALFWVRLIGG